MPVYEYACESHGPFTELRPIRDRDLGAPCPSCGHPASRLIAAPRLALMASTLRKAHEGSERSAHEPRRVHRSSCEHGAHAHGHDAGHGHRHDAAPAKPSLSRARPGTRPWMLGH